MEKDQNVKLEKFKQCEEKLNQSAKNSNKPENWEEMDDAEQQQREIVYGDDEVSEETRQKRKKNKELKPNKKQKLSIKQFQVKQYQQGLVRQRSKVRFFHDCHKPQKLQYKEKDTMLRLIQDLKTAKASQIDLTIATTLKKIGIKSMKTLYRGGAKKQIKIALEFLTQGKIPPEFFQLHKKLLHKKPQEFNGSVRSYLWP